MTPDDFRREALKLPEAVESSHMNHPDFRVGGKIFATIGPGGEWGMVKLTPEQQASFMKNEPGVYYPASGSWGERGATLVTLRDAKPDSVRLGLSLAWRNTAGKKLIERYGAG